MKGDKIIVEDYHKRAAQEIVDRLTSEINKKKERYVITVAGESGSGKSEMGKAIRDELREKGIQSFVFGQDDYFVLPPHSNDTKRRHDPQWLGPHVEVKLGLLEKNIIDAIKGEKAITKPLIDYNKDKILKETVDLQDVEVLIAEGTYTSLLRNVDKRIFIDRKYQETFAHREKRNRGDEVGDPFVEEILATEHKIIAGHKHLADIIITGDYDVVFAEKVN